MIPDLGKNSIVSLYESIALPHKAILGLIPDFGKMLNQSLFEVIGQTNKLVEGIIMPAINFGNMLPEIFRGFEKIIEENERAVEAFRHAGWPIAPSMPKDLIARITELDAEGKTRFASQVIMSYYKRQNYKNLNSMVDGWETHPLFVPRMHIVKDALAAHCNGQYTLSIPALLPLIEGVLHDYIRLNKLVESHKITETIKTAIGDTDDQDIAIWAIANILFLQLENNVYDKFDYKIELSKSRKSRKINRHTVLHGVATHYNKSAYSLRVFLILDAISALRNIS